MKSVGNDLQAPRRPCPAWPALLATLALALPAHAASIIGLGDLPGPGFYSEAYGVSADGKTVVGKSSGPVIMEAFRWTSTGGMVGLGDLPVGSVGSVAVGVSADGAVVVGGGYCPGSSPTPWRGFRWTSGGGTSSFAGSPHGVSADGNTVVGSEGGDYGRPFRWTSSGGSVTLWEPAYRWADALGVSADGSTVVGYGLSASGWEAFRWTSSGTMGLGDLPGGAYYSQAYAASADGSTVVGQGRGASGPEAFRWTSGGGMSGLGDLPGGSFESQARSVSADGNTVVGFGTTSSGQRAFLWTGGAGMLLLEDVLLGAGADLSGWRSLNAANGISPDGRWVVGYGISRTYEQEAFLADLGAPPSVPEGGGTTALAGLAWLTALIVKRRQKR